MHLPYSEIRQSGERRYSAQLMTLLQDASLSEEEEQEVIRCLSAVSDPRTFPALRGLLLDTTQPDQIRARAGKVLRSFDEGPEEDNEEKLRQWWASGDSVLQAHALRSMGRACPDIVEEVASDPSNPLLYDALVAMQYYFTAPKQQQLKSAALSHPDPEIRDCAAYILLWDEPIRAESALLQASHDEDIDVVLQACKTLEYYPTQAVMRRLNELKLHQEKKIAEEAEASLEAHRGGCISALTHKDQRRREHIRRWLAPIWEMLAFTPEDLTPDETVYSPSTSASRGSALPLRELRALLQDPDVSTQALRDKLYANQWDAYPSEERATVRGLVLDSDDLLIRRFAPAMFHAWGEQEELLTFLRDPDFLTRKTATYYLGKAPPYRQEIAQRLWEYFDVAKTWSTHAAETLGAYIKHAPREELRPRLLQLAQAQEQRENIRTMSVDALKEMQAKSEVLELSYLLTEEPPMTWALHISLLEAFVALGLPAPEVAHLFLVDNLDLQIALSPFSGSVPV